MTVYCVFYIVYSVDGVPSHWLPQGLHPHCLVKPPPPHTQPTSLVIYIIISKCVTFVTFHIFQRLPY